jgi:hypothetical protein
VAVAGSADIVITTQSIVAGGTQTVGDSIAGACAGRTFTVTADSANSVDEYHETNNAWSGAL